MLALCLSFATPRALAQASQPEPATASPQSAPSAPQIPQYPDSAKGLTSLAQDIVSAIKKGDAATTRAYMNALVLPDPNTWFAEVFEKDLARESAAEYVEVAASLPAILEGAFRDLADPGVAAITGYHFFEVCDTGMNGNMIVLLSMRKRNLPLDEIRFRVGDDERGIWAFAYVNGGFRYIGNTHLGFGSKPKQIPRAAPAVPSQPEPDNSVTGRVHIGGTVEQAKIIHQVPPEYPGKARTNHVQGTVVMHAIIGKDGSVQQLQVEKGPCVLDEAAIRAVRLWQYSPTLINGEPVEVDTTISVIFTLSH
jgi:TonB family protein